MVFLAGFVLAFAGFALLVLGRAQLPGGRVVTALRGRLAGLVFLLYLPLVIALRPLLDHLEWRATVEQYLTAIDWSLFGLMLVGGGWILLRSARPVKRDVRKPRLLNQPEAAHLFSAGLSNPFPEAEPEPPPDTTPVPRPAKGKRPTPRPQKNPFDFS